MAAADQFRRQRSKVEKLQRQIGAISGSGKRFSETKTRLQQQCVQLKRAIQKEQKTASEIENKIKDLELQLQNTQCDQQKAKQALSSVQEKKVQQMQLMRESEKAFN